MPALVERPHILLHSQTLKADGSGANELIQPANAPDWALYCAAVTYVLSVESVQGAPTPWSLGVKFQLRHADVPNATTSSSYQFAKEAWMDLQNEQVANLIDEGVGWYAGAHAPPAGGGYGIVADQTDTAPSSSTPILVRRTIRSGGQMSRVVFQPLFTGGTSPTVTVSLLAIPVVS